MRSFLALPCLLLAASFLQAQSSRTIEFNRDVRRILSDNCYLCHGPARLTRKADLRLDLEEDAKADLGGYRAIVPGKPMESHLYLRLIEKVPARRMPPRSSHKELTPAQIETLRLWIEQGAKWEKHWAFLPPRRAPLPQVKDAGWVRNPLDRFVLARLEAAGLAPSPQADPATLIRRLSLDLTGLPPTLAEVDAFLRAWSDDADRAYADLVERLLGSPRYGERMVLEWLDAARYSDTNGYQTDGTRAMWPWRDWVIAAFNDDMPYDRFTVEQIAGDLLTGPTVSQKVATGFHRNHMINGEGGRIAEESRVEYVFDRVETTATVWLGLTANCGRCHDHKYDPFSQKEYYGLYAFFNNVAENGGVDRRSSTAAPTLELPTPEQEKQIAAAEKRLAALEQDLKKATPEHLKGQAAWEKKAVAGKLPKEVQAALRIDPGKRNAEQARLVRDQYLKEVPALRKLRETIDQQRKALTGLRNSVVITMIMEDRKEPRVTRVLQRGVYNQYGEEVSARVPDCLPPLPKDARPDRLALARWLVDRGNPLTARVAVNRFWQQFFGTGLVKTTEDFGAQGEPPSHPDLLDWLAVEFMDPQDKKVRPWSMKHLVRLIVTSAAYRQSSRVTPERLEKDPDNRLLSRGPRIRLSPFALRDQALFVSGLLVEKVGGPPVRPYQPPRLWEDFSFNQIRYVQDHGDKLYRRSLYTFWRRSIAPPNMFDTPSRQVCTVKASRTNTPLHALILLNDVTFVEAARVWAQHLLQSGGKTPEQRLHRAFRQLTARNPRPAELTLLRDAHARVLSRFRGDLDAARKLIAAGEYARPEGLDPAEHAALTAVLNMLLNLDEAIVKE